MLRFLRLEQLSGASTSCALILATARASAKGPAGGVVHGALVAALGREIGRLKATLQKRELPEIDFNNALSFGSAIADDTDCEALQMVRTRLAATSTGFPGHAADELGDAAELGLLTGKLERLSAPPKPPVAKDGSTACRDATPLALDQSCKTSRDVTITRVKRGKRNRVEEAEGTQWAPLRAPRGTGPSISSRSLRSASGRLSTPLQRCSWRARSSPRTTVVRAGNHRFNAIISG